MKNRITKCVAMVAILCVLITALAAPALAASYSKIYGQTQSRIRVRASASSSANIIDNIIKGACVYVTTSKTSGSTTFVKVNYRNSDGDIDSGWVCQSDSTGTYVKILSAEQAKTAFSVSGGSLPSKKVGTFTAAERKSATSTTTTSTSSSDSTDVATIKSVQTMLKALGYYTGEITGNVGDKTKAAIKKFQGEYDLTVDGVAGPKTIAKLESVYGDSGSSSSSSSSGTALKLGSTGTKVRDLQLDLTTLGYYWADITGNYGAKTQAAVKNFQEKNNLTADGVAGTKTINAIAAAIARKGGTSSTSTTGTTLKLNSQGTAVSDLQTDLKQLGYYYADITGNFGSKTEAAVKSFQAAKGLTADGVAGTKTLTAIASAISAAGGSVSDSSSGTLKLGSTGDKVRDLQTDLTALGYYYGDITGHYGSMTQTAVKKFQKAKGLTQDGVAGSTTISAISKALVASGSTSASSSSSGSSLREGDSGDAVLEMQTMLKELGYYYGSLTGNFGSLTKKAVRAFQDAQGLTVDGIAGTNTLNKLYALTGKTSSSSTSASGTTVTEANSYGRINKDNVNLRSSYSTTSAAKASLDSGKVLRITKVYNVAGVKWYYVTVQTGSVTHKGYVRADMVTTITASEYASGGGDVDMDLGDSEIIGMIRVTGTTVNLRSEPSTSATKVGTASKGDVFYYVDHKSGWYQTRASYWINDDYVTVLTEEEAEDYADSTVDGGTYKRGDTGSMVLWIQEALKSLKYYSGSLTGSFGPLTEEAVKKFQRDNGLSADGVVGSKTLAAIVSALGSGNGSSGDVAYGEKIYNIQWSTMKEKKLIEKNDKLTVKDIRTGKSFAVKVQSTGNHADVEPLTDDDTAVLCAIYGLANANQFVTNNVWYRRAIVVTNPDGEQFVGSMYAVPHGLNTIDGNDFDGQFCIHFLGSTIHSGDGGSVSESENHQAKIKAGVSALQSAGYTVSTTYP